VGRIRAERPIRCERVREAHAEVASGAVRRVGAPNHKPARDFGRRGVGDVEGPRWNLLATNR
jgi:hypothetical protein